MFCCGIQQFEPNASTGMHLQCKYKRQISPNRRPPMTIERSVPIVSKFEIFHTQTLQQFRWFLWSAIHSGWFYPMLYSRTWCVSTLLPIWMNILMLHNVNEGVNYWLFDILWMFLYLKSNLSYTMHWERVPKRPI